MKQTETTRRLAQEAREKIATILRQEISDPRLADVTVTGCEVSVDRSICKVYVAAPPGTYDEVLAGLNPNEMLSSLDYVREINRRGITILFVEHVMRAVVSVCTRAVVLNEGKFLYEGTPTDALNDPTVIAAYIGGGNKNDA